jgi:hypothetical protein
VNTGRYSKLIVAAIGTIMTGLTVKYPTPNYLVPIITSALSTLGVWAVPNTPAPPPGPGMVADITAAVDDLLARRLARPRLVPLVPVPPAATGAPEPSPSPNVQVLPSQPPLQAGDVGPVPS